MGAPLCSLPVPRGFGGRAESEVSKGCVFSWDALVAAALVRGKPGKLEGLEPKPCEFWGFSQDQWLLPCSQRVRLEPKGLEQEP